MSPLKWTDFRHLQLDIVGFLAILGEGSVDATNRIAALSRITFLPRLLPAPQALLQPSRETSLERFVGKVVGVYSGNSSEHVNYLAHLIHQGEDMPKWQVQTAKITKKSNRPIRARTTGPLVWAALLGHAESIVLLALSIYFRDGFAIISTVLFSFLSTIAGIGNKRKLNITTRPNPNRPVPPGDIVIKYPVGCFVYIKCEETVARELYFAPEELEYLIENPSVFRLISLVGTMMLMLGVVVLANAKKEMQICYGTAYVILNAVYWTVAALPNRLHWDTSAYFWEPILDDPRFKPNEHGIAQYHDFTTALWKTIQISGTSQWVQWASIAPKSKAWDKWLNEADIMCKAKKEWNASEALTRFIKEESDSESVPLSTPTKA